MKSLLVRAGVILIGLVIFGSTEVCKAQCAWVLWHGHSDDNTTWRWSLGSAYPTAQECDQQAKATIKFWVDESRKVGKKVENIYSQGYVVIDETGRATFYRHQCFPDTVDPRKRGEF